MTALGNSGGTLQASYKYDPYGRLVSQSGPLSGANLLRWSSKPWMGFAGSSTDGLYYYGYRFYEPYLQRWLNRDPIGETGGNNLYVFTQNAPTFKIDSHGQIVFPILLCVGAVAFLCGCDNAPPPQPQPSDWDRLGDALKEWFAENFGGQEWNDAVDACEAIKDTPPDYFHPGIWEDNCQRCATAKCALESKTPEEARQCLNIKFLNCTLGILP